MELKDSTSVKSLIQSLSFSSSMGGSGNFVSELEASLASSVDFSSALNFKGSGTNAVELKKTSNIIEAKESVVSSDNSVKDKASSKIDNNSKSEKSSASEEKEPVKAETKEEEAVASKDVEDKKVSEEKEGDAVDDLEAGKKTDVATKEDSVDEDLDLDEVVEEILVATPDVLDVVSLATGGVAVDVVEFVDAPLDAELSLSDDVVVSDLVDSEGGQGAVFNAVDVLKPELSTLSSFVEELGAVDIASASKSASTFVDDLVVAEVAPVVIEEGVEVQTSFVASSEALEGEVPLTFANAVVEEAGIDVALNVESALAPDVEAASVEFSEVEGTVGSVDAEVVSESVLEGVNPEVFVENNVAETLVVASDDLDLVVDEKVDVSNFVTSDVEAPVLDASGNLVVENKPENVVHQERELAGRLEISKNLDIDVSVKEQGFDYSKPQIKIVAEDVPVVDAVDVDEVVLPKVVKADALVNNPLVNVANIAVSQQNNLAAVSADTAINVTQNNINPIGFEAVNSTKLNLGQVDSKMLSANDTFVATSKDVIDQIKVNITKSAVTGVDKIDISLTPEDLGKLSIKMEIKKDGSLDVNVMASSKETMELLQKDMSSLQKAFEDAGFKMNGNSLSFSHNQDGGENNNSNARQARLDFMAEALSETPSEEVVYDGTSALNIKV